MQPLLQMVINVSHNFPLDYVNAATALVAKFEGEGWGEEPKEDKESNEKSQNEPPKKKAKYSSPKTTTSSQVTVRRPAANHPIFGASGIMRGILTKRGETTSYSLDPHFNKTAFNVFGANGLAIGAWWPRQVCALRDGAHGSKMGGISGTGDEGCYSVVISKLYDGIDHDGGDRVLYSSTKQDSLTDVKANTGTKALLRSIESRRPVRVLRGSGSKWQGAPQVGFRFDGLYKVVSSKEVNNGDDGAYIQFELVRLAGQSPIDRAKPTALQIDQFERIKAGY